MTETQTDKTSTLYASSAIQTAGKSPVRRAHSTRSPQGAKKHSYSFVIAACCFAMLFVNMGLSTTSFNVYQSYLVAMPGVGDANGSIVIAVRMLIAAIALLFVARFYEIVPARVGVAVSVAFTGVGFIFYGMAANVSADASSMPLLMLGAIVCGVGYAFGGIVPMTMLMNRWFCRDVSSIVGYVSAGSGLDAAVMPVVIHFFISNFSLAAAFWFEALLSFLIGVVCLILIRDRPSSLGLEPHPLTKRGGGEHIHNHEHPIANNRNLSPRARYAMYATGFFSGTIGISAFSYLGILLTTESFDPGFVAGLLSVGGICITASKILTGRMFAALGTRRGCTIVYGFLIVGLISCSFMGLHSVLIAVVAIIAMYIGGSLTTVAMPMWGLELAHPGSQTRLVKDLQVCYSAGGLTFNLLPGFLMQMTGGYEITYAIILIFAVASLVIVDWVYKNYRQAPGFIRRKK